MTYNNELYLLLDKSNFKKWIKEVTLSWISLLKPEEKNELATKNFWKEYKREDFRERVLYHVNTKGKKLVFYEHDTVGDCITVSWIFFPIAKAFEHIKMMCCIWHTHIQGKCIHIYFIYFHSINSKTLLTTLNPFWSRARYEQINNTLLIIPLKGLSWTIQVVLNFVFRLELCGKLYKYLSPTI